MTLTLYVLTTTNSTHTVCNEENAFDCEDHWYNERMEHIPYYAEGSGYCIPEYQVCDGIKDCGNDENFCEGYLLLETG